MADVTVKKEDEIEVKWGGFELVRDGLGISSFGVQIMKLPPNNDKYPEHDHSEDGQEELYVILEGSAKLVADGEEFDLGEGDFARVGPNVKRKITPGDQGIKLLAVGGTPGKAYEIPDYSKPKEEAGV